MSFFHYITQDWKCNKDNTKGKIIIILFRAAAYVGSGKLTKIIFSPYLFFYKIFVEWLLGIELPWPLKVGRNLQVFHGQATIINKDVRIGSNCVIRHSTTIGNAKDGGRCPTIGNNVNIGCNVCIIGEIKIGDNVIIGAGAVVTKDVPENSNVYGNPMKIVARLQ